MLPHFETLGIGGLAARNALESRLFRQLFTCGGRPKGIGMELETGTTNVNICISKSTSKTVYSHPFVHYQ